MNIPLFLRAGIILLILLATLGCRDSDTTSTNNQFVPSPDQMRVDIDINGRVSTLKHIDIKHVGKQIPYTYSDGKIANSPDYDWWVSKHFAIKSDLPFDKVKLYLELLEMSYPHYVELFGHQPPNIERQRIAVVYGSSRAKVKDAMFDDGFLRGVHKHAGGETMYYNRAGYSFPSHREQHQRYIVIHETMHAFHMALNGHSTWAPNWITEGLADAIAHHVYDPKQNQLTVMVFDRAPMNYVEVGLKQFAELNQPSMTDINALPSLKRGLNFLMIHYLLSEPELNHKFKLFLTKLMHANPHSDDTAPTTNRILREVFNNWSEVETGFQQFVASARSSFEIIDGPWEQDGNAFWIRQYNHEKTAQLNIDVTPSGDEEAQVRKFDFPAPPTPAALKPQQKGDIGFTIDYLPEHTDRGFNGIGFRLPNQDKLFSITVKEGRLAELKTQEQPDSNQTFTLKKELTEALEASNNIHVAIRFRQNDLELYLTSDHASQNISIRLPKELLNNLMTSRLALVANNNNNRLTPYFNESRAPQLGQKVQGSNVWGLNNSKQLSAVLANCYEDSCQNKVEDIYNLIAKQQSDEADLAIESLYRSIYLGAKAKTELYAPLMTTVSYHNKTPYIRVDNQLEAMSGSIQVEYFDEENQLIDTVTNQADFSYGTNNIDLVPPVAAAYLRAKAKSKPSQTDAELSMETPTMAIQPFDGVELTLSNQNGKINTRLSGPYSGPTEGKLTLRLLNPNQKQYSFETRDIKIAPYQIKDLSFELPDGAVQGVIEAVAILNVDGEGVKITKTLEL